MAPKYFVAGIVPPFYICIGQLIHISDLVDVVENRFLFMLLNLPIPDGFIIEEVLLNRLCSLHFPSQILQLILFRPFLVIANCPSVVVLRLLIYCNLIFTLTLIFLLFNC